jgi:hypothetical protein
VTKTTIPLHPDECKACEACRDQNITVYCKDHDMYDVPTFERKADDIDIEEYEDYEDRCEQVEFEAMENNYIDSMVENWGAI